MLNEIYEGSVYFTQRHGRTIMVLVLSYDKETEMCNCIILDSTTPLKIHKKNLYHTIIDVLDKMEENTHENKIYRK